MKNKSEKKLTFQSSETSDKNEGDRLQENDRLPSLEDECLQNFEDEMRYSFRDKKLLKEALTQSANKKAAFFGDSVLGFIVSEYLFVNFSELEQGDLTTLKSHLVCDEKLEKIIKKKNWDQYLITENGITEKSKKMNSTFLEAVVGAIYLDGGLRPAADFVQKHIVTKREAEKQLKNLVSPKVRLYEFCQQQYGGYRPDSFLISEEGPPHDKRFIMGYLLSKEITRLDQNIMAEGAGRTKADAETKAAEKINLKLIRLGLMEKK
jgi:ribonuclease-3